VKINSSSPVCLSLRVLCCPILLATGFEKSVFRFLKKSVVSASRYSYFLIAKPAKSRGKSKKLNF
jgi:hypothetical protein